MKQVFLLITMVVLVSFLSSCAVDRDQTVSAPTPKKWGKMYD